MKKLFSLLSFLFFLSQPGFTQDGYTFLGIRGGWVYEKAFNTSISLELAGGYHTAFELFAEHYRNTGSEYHATLGGFLYKPVLTRKKNFTFRARFGAGFGGDKDGFLGGPEAGLEFMHTLPGGVNLMLTSRNKLLFGAPAPERWRTGVELGIGIPL